jgi:hypothetical protein
VSVVDENGSPYYEPVTLKKEYCLSIQKQNIILENTECPFGGKIRPTLEIEGEYIFNDNASEDRNYYNSQDARDLEFEFNKIKKM